jgi:Holin of 3TMs, for gene-transfer release
MASAITNLLGGSITDGVAKIIGLFKVDPTVALAKQTELQEITLKMQADAAAAVAQQLHDQAAVNQVEAASQKLFVAGWRPFIGWVCGSGLAVQFILGPFVTWAATLAKHPVAFPTLDMGTLMTLLLGMLGLGGMRTFEKVNGVNAGH